MKGEVWRCRVGVEGECYRESRGFGGGRGGRGTYAAHDVIIACEMGFTVLATEDLVAVQILVVGETHFPEPPRSLSPGLCSWLMCVRVYRFDSDLRFFLQSRDCNLLLLLCHCKL